MAAQLYQIDLPGTLKAEAMRSRVVRYCFRHTAATDALITLRQNWANFLDSIDKLKQDQVTVKNCITVAESLLQVITDSIREDTEDNLSKTIRDSAGLSADIIKTAQERFFKGLILNGNKFENSKKVI